MLGTRLVSYAAHTLALESYEVADEPGPGEVLVETASTLISAGTEVANYVGNTVQRAAVAADWRKHPYYPGYSLAGYVRAAGEGVSDLIVGDRIAGSAPHASWVLASALRFVRMPESLSFDESAWSTLIAIVLNAVRLGQIQLGECVAVVGVGPIGQLAAQLARLCGARPVVAMDVIPARLKAAQECGAHAVLNLAEDSTRTLNPMDSAAARLIAEVTEGRGFDVVFEATGTPAALSPALKMAARGGRVVLLGSTRGLVESFDPYRDVHFKGVTLIGAHASTAPSYASLNSRWTERENRRLGLNLVADRSLQVDRLISHRVPAAQGPEVYRRLATARADFLGVVLHWHEGQGDEIKAG